MKSIIFYKYSDLTDWDLSEYWKISITVVSFQISDGELPVGTVVLESWIFLLLLAEIYFFHRNKFCYSLHQHLQLLFDDEVYLFLIAYL